VLMNRFGQGTVIYSAGVIESWEHDSQRQVLFNLVRLLAQRPFVVRTEAPKSVEVTLFAQEERRRYVLNVLNYQQELPNIPVHGLKIAIRMDGRRPKGAVMLPEGTSLGFRQQGDSVEIELPILQDFSMIGIEWV
jgi:hypothetical protein